MGTLDGKVAIVTGGAGAIGAAIVRRFVREGARVVALDIAKENGEALAHELGEPAIFLSCNHESEDDCRSAVATVLGKWGAIDILHNNAGRGAHGRIDELPDEALQGDLGVNLIGPWRMTRAALPALKESAQKDPENGAVLLFTSSASGLFGEKNLSTYAAAKHAVIGLMRATAADLGPLNIRVNAICPGVVDTPTKIQSRTGWRRANFEEALAQTPLRRVATPDDIASVSAFLSSRDGRAISGQALLVDCGLRSH